MSDLTHPMETVGKITWFSYNTRHHRFRRMKQIIYEFFTDIQIFVSEIISNLFKLLSHYFINTHFLYFTQISNHLFASFLSKSVNIFCFLHIYPFFLTSNFLGEFSSFNFFIIFSKHAALSATHLVNRWLKLLVTDANV